MTQGLAVRQSTFYSYQEILSEIGETYRRHKIEFHGHGDYIEANDCGDSKIKVFARTHLVKPRSPRRVVQPVW